MTLTRSRALSRGAPLKRKARVRRHRKPVNRPEHRIDEAFKAFVRKLPCRLAWLGNCCGIVDPDHMGADKGVGLKAPDSTVAPLCRRHHDERQQWRGYFDDWTKARMRAWCDEQIAATRMQYARHREGAA